MTKKKFLHFYPFSFKTSQHLYKSHFLFSLDLKQNKFWIRLCKFYLRLGNAQKSDSSLQTGINAYTTPMLRGAKKKKGPDGPAEAESSDIINIFKDKTDPEIKPIEEYPVWLVELLDFKKNTDTVLHGMMHGLKHDHPQTYDLRTLMNHMRRRRITDMNRFTAFDKGQFDKRDPLDWNMESIIKAADEEAVQQEEEEEEEGDEE